jgi:hypothetical protein
MCRAFLVGMIERETALQPLCVSDLNPIRANVATSVVGRKFSDADVHAISFVASCEVKSDGILCPSDNDGASVAEQNVDVVIGISHFLSFFLLDGSLH